MEIVQAFIPLVTFWVCLLGASTACTFAVSAFRKKSLPALDPLFALIGSVTALYFAIIQDQYPIVLGIALLISVTGAFSASAWSLATMRDAATPDLNDQQKS